MIIGRQIGVFKDPPGVGLRWKESIFIRATIRLFIGEFNIEHLYYSGGFNGVMTLLLSQIDSEVCSEIRRKLV